MQAAVRSYKTMGVTLVGASVIAVSPMAPPLPHLHLPALDVSSVAVKLSALSNPIEQWAQLLQTTLSNVGQLGQAVVANPAPVLGQVVTNQVASAQVLAQVVEGLGQGFVQQLVATPGELQAAFQQLASGDIPGGLNAVLSAVTGPVLVPLLNVFLFSPLGAELTNVLQQPFANLSAAVNVLTNTNNLLPIILSPFNIAQNMTDAVSVSAQAMVAAVNQENIAAFASAIIGLAPALVGAIINGSPLAPASEGEGLLGPEGPLAGILTLAQLVAKAITPATTVAASFAANALPAASAKLVTLDVASPTTDVGALALTKVAATAAPAAATGTEIGKVVRQHSPTTDSGTTGTSATKPSRPNPTKDVTDGIRTASKHDGDGSTNAAAGHGAKSSSTRTGGSKSSAGGSNGGGKHRADK
jgi:uncharacterized membrane protein YgcG